MRVLLRKEVSDVIKKNYQVPPKEKAIEIIKSYLLGNQLKSGDLLPSERVLSESFGISRTTFRSAIDQLKKEYRLYSVTGSGTYVSEQKFLINLHDLKSTTTVIRESGKTLTTQVISNRIIEANKEIAAHFKQVLGAPFFELIRCRCIDGVPVFYETSITDYSRFKGIEEYDFSKESLFDILETKFSTKIQRGTESLGITFPTSVESECLKISQKVPVYVIHSINYDSAGKVTEITKRIVRSDKVTYMNEYLNKVNKQ